MATYIFEKFLKTFYLKSKKIEKTQRIVLYVIIDYKFMEPFRWVKVLLKGEPSNLFLEIGE